MYEIVINWLRIASQQYALATRLTYMIMLNCEAQNALL